MLLWMGWTLVSLVLLILGMFWHLTNVHFEQSIADVLQHCGIQPGSRIEITRHFGMDASVEVWFEVPPDQVYQGECFQDPPREYEPGDGPHFFGIVTEELAGKIIAGERMHRVIPGTKCDPLYCNASVFVLEHGYAFVSIRKI